MASAWETISNNRRRETRYRVRLTASVSIVEGLDENQWPTSLAYTRDLSREGLCLVMPSSRMGCHNLEDANHVMRVILVLPSGVSIDLQSQLVYCTTYTAESDAGYLAGVKIMKINLEDRIVYNEFIGSLRRE
jgi:hypothetical protein